ncbi:MAG: peptide-methionine (S)-S-oxide reductase [Alphaproteobacteria bacterium]|nr:peptide-methionine (S)-S-oxide reductase [Alphaproteobacteria bacterium]
MRLSGPIGIALALLPVLAALPLITARSETATRLEAPALDAPTGDGLQTAVLAGGCFWGIQAVYQHTKGVTNAVSGYAGGKKEDADYSSVSYGRTLHAEAVQVTFDPRVVSYGKILQIFFSVAHDPTQLNRQGPDHGPQYRSEIFPQTDMQRQVAKAYVAQLDAAKSFAKPIVTKLDTDKAAFYPAEDYHQDYAVKHPNQPYIVINDAPKVANLKTMFADLYREAPVTVAAAKAAGH